MNNFIKPLTYIVSNDKVYIFKEYIEKNIKVCKHLTASY